MLADQVKAGTLPAVEERLPKEPLVVEGAEGVGQYGGTWRRGFTGPSDYNNYVRVVFDGLVRFSPDGSKVEPKVAQGLGKLRRLQRVDRPAARRRQVVRRHSR